MDLDIRLANFYQVLKSQHPCDRLGSVRDVAPIANPHHKLYHICL